MVLVICLLLAAGAIGFTLFVREQDVPPAPVENPELRHLEDRRQTLYENLKDLQFEFHQGKLTDDDYQSLKQGFLYDLAAIMDSVERLEFRGGKQSKTQPKSESAEEPEQKSKAMGSPAPIAPASNTCPSCKVSNPAGNRFCGQCGQPLPV